jgi:hypothetical protein
MPAVDAAYNTSMGQVIATFKSDQILAWWWCWRQSGVMFETVWPVLKVCRECFNFVEIILLA